MMQDNWKYEEHSETGKIENRLRSTKEGEGCRHTDNNGDIFLCNFLYYQNSWCSSFEFVAVDCLRIFCLS